MNALCAKTSTASVIIHSPSTSPRGVHVRPYYSQRMGGYVTRYTTPASANGGSFDFLTIRGAGHMVPQMQPAAAIEFFTRWLKNEPYKNYTPKGESKSEIETTDVQGRSKEAHLAALEGHLESQLKVWAAKEEDIRKEIAQLKTEL